MKTGEYGFTIWHFQVGHFLGRRFDAQPLLEIALRNALIRRQNAVAAQHVETGIRSVEVQRRSTAVVAIASACFGRDEFKTLGVGRAHAVGQGLADVAGHALDVFHIKTHVAEAQGVGPTKLGRVGVHGHGSPGTGTSEMADPLARRRGAVDSTAIGG